MEIKNCTFMITGGASGLGAATVRQIVKAGGNVAIFDMQQEKAPIWLPNWEIKLFFV